MPPRVFRKYYLFYKNADEKNTISDYEISGGTICSP